MMNPKTAREMPPIRRSRPGIARAIAQARDERKATDMPAPKEVAPKESREEPDFEVIPVRRTAIDIARIANGAKNF